MLQEIIIGVTIILVIYFVYMLLNYFKIFEGSSLTGLLDANESTSISGSLYNPNNLDINNYGFIIWFYVNDWGENYTSDRYIISMTSEDGASQSIGAYFPGSTNDLRIEWSDKPSGTTHCEIDNIPSQKWVCLGISKYNNTFDVYIDGKLANTCSSSNTVVNIGSQNEITMHDSSISSKNGFDGYTKNFRFYTKELDPSKVYDVYKYGSSGNIFDNILGNYKMRMSLLKNDEEIAGVGLG